MHGCSEASDSAKPFVHAMGPSGWESTMQYGLRQGKVFGVIGSTDHHSAHPGSYGHGKTAVWATELGRAQIWEVLYARRTYALTGDNIEVVFSINDAPMGSVQPFERSRSISASIGFYIPYEEWTEEVKANYSYDPERAKQLLAEADYPDGFKTTLELDKIWFNTDVDYAQIAKDYWAQIGVDVEIKFRHKQIHRSQSSDEPSDSGTREVGSAHFRVLTLGAPTLFSASSIISRSVIHSSMLK
jgi:hypothetical protein